jgi:CDP-diacylglycerol--serine O-phosphatidyltransferase
LKDKHRTHYESFLICKNQSSHCKQNTLSLQPFMAILKHIPNFLTLSNLFSGCTGIAMVSLGYFRWGALSIFLSALLDFFDGLAARALKANSPIGKDLDSLADVVSFGVLPSFMLFSYLTILDQAVIIHVTYTYPVLPFQFINLSVFIMAVFSALRLARFNHDPEQQTSFKGLPTPANGLFWAAMFMGLCSTLGISQLNWFQPDITLIKEATTADEESFLWLWLFKNKLALLGLSLFMSFFLIAPFRLISFKLKNWSWQENKYTYLFFLLSVILGISIGYEAAPIVLILYILFSIITYRKSFLS